MRADCQENGRIQMEQCSFSSGVEGRQADKKPDTVGKAVEGWAKELELPQDEGTVDMLRKRTHSGCPCGDDDFIERLSRLLWCPPVRRPRGRPRKH